MQSLEYGYQPGNKKASSNNVVDDDLNSVYQTQGDRSANHGRTTGLTRSYSRHKLYSSGSMERIHGHENDGSGFERVIEYTDRNGNKMNFA